MSTGCLVIDPAELRASLIPLLRWWWHEWCFVGVSEPVARADTGLEEVIEDGGADWFAGLGSAWGLHWEPPMADGRGKFSSSQRSEYWPSSRGKGLATVCRPWPPPRRLGQPRARPRNRLPQRIASRGAPRPECPGAGRVGGLSTMAEPTRGQARAGLRFLSSPRWLNLAWQVG